MTDRAERQVGERLSEDARVRLDRSDPNWKQHLVEWLRRAEADNARAGHLGDAELYGAAADKIEAQARQLAEAERDTERLRDMLVSRGLSRAQITERLAALNPPDPPASPADDYANCDCNVPPMEGHGQHAPDCSIFAAPATEKDGGGE